MDYVINIPVASTMSTSCNQIEIQSLGDSRYTRDGWYAKNAIFGTYRFASTDERGNRIYHANVQRDRDIATETEDEDIFICKSIHNLWLVRIIHP